MLSLLLWLQSWAPAFYCRWHSLQLSIATSARGCQIYKWFEMQVVAVRVQRSANSLSIFGWWWSLVVVAHRSISAKLDMTRPSLTQYMYLPAPVETTKTQFNFRDPFCLFVVHTKQPCYTENLYRGFKGCKFIHNGLWSFEVCMTWFEAWNGVIPS